MSCNELGYFQPIDAKSIGSKWKAGKISLKYFVDLCYDIFHNPKFTIDWIKKQVEATNVYYGGMEMRGASHIILPSGSLDSWRIIGKLSSDNPAIVPVVIEGESHASDMYAPVSEDSDALKKARKKIETTLFKWLGITIE
ncbi:hypothetical protein WR25_08359 [Diploscapter pachys]|uniref:Uncharacterized protein n=1 Tax=Diploscapter pachys TaxID=2018661 RepID=A0A2A2KGM9_9BILA|nr:hypothetical protein WR25_08359 [Diploscapter pachys]